MAKILIIRFSALGDVAMTIPLLYSFAKSHPNDQICFLSRRSFQPFFLNMPQNMRYLKADLSGKHKGLTGLATLYDKLAEEKFDYVIDLHSVLRSKYLTFRFKISAVKTATIDKGRKEKKALTRQKDKVFVQLTSSFDRYYEPFEKLGLGFSPDFKSVYLQNPTNVEELSSLTEPKGSEKWIGIAPFAKHMGKVYPEILMTKVVETLSLDPRYKVFIFGGGPDEQAAVNGWIKKYPTIVSAISKLTIDQQLLLMSQLDIMVSMDSGNMHLASLVGTPVISVWGATHPYAGFLGWNQSESNIIQTDLPCRPCSVFGDKPCFRKDYACMYQIKPETIIQKIEENLSGSR